MAYITLNFDHYRHNLTLLGKQCGDMQKLMVVLKNNAYGHGLTQIAPLAAAAGIKHAAVKNCAEARQIEGLFETVLVLADLPQADAHPMLSYAIHSLERLDSLPPHTRVHVNVDTGMHRNGIMPEALDKAFEIVQRNNLVLEALFTHYHSADEVGAAYFVQKERFALVKKEAKALAHAKGLKVPKFHACNSAGVLRHKGVFEEDFARVGIASYGYTDMPEVLGRFDLKPVLALWGSRMSSRDIQVGQKVGYGGTFEATRPMRISTYDLGYGDGVFRFDTAKPVCVQNGKPLLGRVSMDSFTVEGEEEEVCVFSDATSMANHAGTITYEVLTRLAPWLPRRVLSAT